MSLSLFKGREGEGEGGALNPSIAMPALLITISIPSGCSFFKNAAKSSMLCSELMSSPWYSIVLRPPSFASAFALRSWGSDWRDCTAASPRDLLRAVR